MPKPSKNVSANEGIKPPDSPEQRKFLAGVEADRRAAAAKESARQATMKAEEAAAQRRKEDEMGKAADQRDKDRKMQEAYTRATGIKLAKGGSVSSASKRADGCATKGKTKGRFV